MPKSKPKTKPRLNPQIKVTIPFGQLAAVREAMAFDGSTKTSAFALAAIMQRTNRLLAQKALEQKRPGA